MLHQDLFVRSQSSLRPDMSAGVRRLRLKWQQNVGHDVLFWVALSACVAGAPLLGNLLTCMSGGSTILSRTCLCSFLGSWAYPYEWIAPDANVPQISTRWFANGFLWVII